MNAILFTAVSLIGIIGISLLVILPIGIPGRRRTLAALHRAEAGATDLIDLELLVKGHSHPVFYMLRGYTERIRIQCERIFDDLGVAREEFGWEYSRGFESFAQ